MDREFHIASVEDFRARLITYLRKREHFFLLNSCGYYENKDPAQHPYYHDYELIAGIGSSRALSPGREDFFEAAHSLSREEKKYLFGYFGYDLKKETLGIAAKKDDPLEFPEGTFIVPEITLILTPEKKLVIHSVKEDPVKILDEINGSPKQEGAAGKLTLEGLSPITPRDLYVENVNKIRDHIYEGDFYEMNYCQNFVLHGKIDPFTTYLNLIDLSPTPFSSFVRLGDKYILSASPERFLKKSGNRLISQPIKGTRPRGTTREGDLQLMEELLADEKERAENVMIVDLVRNDLNRSCRPGTVEVEELFGIYEFPNVFQMISTVTGELAPGIHWYEAIKNAFPMGSMTGAPKKKVVEAIEEMENFKRGVYSGSIGYITPSGDFDFNVVIRTFLYNDTKELLSIPAGSAITYDSDPEQEYRECLVKIKKLVEAIS